MILDTISNAGCIEQLHPLFAKLFEYLRTHDLTRMQPGRIEIQGDDLFINLSQATLVDEAAQKLEVHRRYIDVHFPLDGEERVGWKPLADIQGESEAPFDTDHDFALYAEPASTYFTAHPGEFYVMYPEDAHAPIIGTGTLLKAVAKVKI